MLYIVRELVKTDFENYLELINDFRKTTFDQNQFNNILEGLGSTIRIFVIEKDLKLIATGTLIIEQKFIYNCTKMGHIEDVCVKKEFRCQGFGKIIIRKLIDIATEHKCYKITLTCSESNIPFYKTNNFDIRGVHMSQLLNK